MVTRTRKLQQFALYAQPGQFRIWREWADMEGKSLTAWIRDTLDSVINAEDAVYGNSDGEEVVRIPHKVVFSDER